MIELLAVIVVLAIIALIATPIVLNIIGNAKKSSNERSGELYIKAVENAIMKKQLNGTDVVTSGDYTVQSDGSICIVSNNVCQEGTTIIIDVEGDSPTEGTITVSNGVVTDYTLTVSGTSVTKGESSDNEDDEEVEASATFSGYYTEFEEDGFPIEESFVAEEKTLTWEQLIDGVDKDKYKYNNDYITATEIVENAFLCSTLTNITIPSTVTKIGVWAFLLSDLTTITIGDGVTSIGERAFESCYNLTSINVDNNNTNYSSLNGVLLNKNKTEIINYPEGKTTSYEIPSSVTSIRARAFSGCKLITITIPNTVTSIVEEAFDEASLTSVTYNGTLYTSKSSLTTALTNNGVTLGDNIFHHTGLSN